MRERKKETISCFAFGFWGSLARSEIARSLLRACGREGGEGVMRRWNFGKDFPTEFKRGRKRKACSNTELHNAITPG